jgi:dihydroorotase-like cyclic amidohydrolase
MEGMAMTKLLLKNATVYPITSSIMNNGDVLIQNGKIANLGVGLLPDEETQVIDCKNNHLLPGFI